jgi:SAM-dependent methyltransferase
MSTKYWKTNKAIEYIAIAGGELISDIPAYRFVYQKLFPLNKTVLDVGSFFGESTEIIESLGARYVKGIDNNPEFISSAKERYAANHKVSFDLTDVGVPIKLPPREKGYEAAVATFVHPTIGTKEELSDLFCRVNNVLLPGGEFFLLGLHPLSFCSDYHFLSYKHELPSSGGYTDAEPFAVNLINNNGSIISFFDYCWTEETLRSMFLECGYESVEVFNLQLDMLESYERELLEKILSKVSSDHPKLKNADEFYKVPLHQVFIATKAH